MKSKKLIIFCILQFLFMNALNASSEDTDNHSIVSENDYVLAKKLKKMEAAEKNPLTIAFYRPTYILPFNYTCSPYTQVYNGNTPVGQSIMHSELKAQLSLMIPVIAHLFDNKTALNIGYTQLSYWQVYAASQYFRETDYEPEIFVTRKIQPNWLMTTGLDHQSNGRGGTYERSWNRMIVSSLYSGENWVVGLKLWYLIFKNDSSNLHNPDIAHYLGYDAILFSYKLQKLTASLQLQNIESGLARGSAIVTLSYPMTKHFLIYTQLFKGYGQSLIEYNHKTKSFGIGIAFNDWI